MKCVSIKFIVIWSLLYSFFRGWSSNDVIDTSEVYIIGLALPLIGGIMSGKIRRMGGHEWYGPFVLLVVLIMLVISHFIVYNGGVTQKMLAYLVLFVVPILVAMARKCKETGLLKGVLVINGIYLILTFVYGVISGTLFGFGRFVGLIPAVNQFGLNMVIIIGAGVLGLLSYGNNKMGKRLGWLSVIGGSTGLLLSQGRGAMILVVAFFVVIVWRYKLNVINAIINNPRGVVLVLIPLVWVLINNYEMLGERYIAAFVGNGNEYSVSHLSRAAVFKDVWMKFPITVKAMLFGMGLDQFMIFGGGYPHNMFLEVLVDLGLLVAILLMMVYWGLSAVFMRRHYGAGYYFVVMFYFLTLFSTLYTAQFPKTIQLGALFGLLVSWKKDIV